MPAVVGIDGSRHAERALDWAMREAALRHAQLTVISVFPLGGSRFGDGAAVPEDAGPLEGTRLAAQEAVVIIPKQPRC